ncbi:MAG: PIG-L family deacetylase [Clostridiales bacterium]|jgi:LmbE family N-acetylglucosaminyl deacetylase|nr:PIG-L family deacetylase [Clostridiales bacterium]
MTFNNHSAEVYIPDNAKKGSVVYLALAAHQDDIEIMAADGILKAFNRKNGGFVAVVTTDGAGSARDGIYKAYTDDDMMKIRRAEQKKAAVVGEYSALYLLNYQSAAVKSPKNIAIAEDYIKILKKHKPEIVYTHNLLDRHDTHLGVATKAVAAVRNLPKADRPKRLYGCEVWRDLDWLPDSEKTGFDLSANENLLAALLGVFDSQITGGKRYDLATQGRRLSNATYSASHSVDAVKSVSYALDLTPLINDVKADITDFALSKIEAFKKEAESKLKNVLQG